MGFEDHILGVPWIYGLGVMGLKLGKMTPKIAICMIEVWKWRSSNLFFHWLQWSLIG